jgi:hypothetical protein
VRSLSLNSDAWKPALGVVAAAAVLALALTGGSPGQERPMFGSNPSEGDADSRKIEQRSPAPLPSAPSSPTADKPADRGGNAKAASGGTVTEQVTVPAPDASPAPAKVHPKPSPSPAPATPAPQTNSKPEPPSSALLTSAQVRALPGGASIGAVKSALGAPASTSELEARFGKGAVRGLRHQEPAGMICRYYRLVATEPAPLVRICFDANGIMRSREFVAPQA